MWKRENTLRNSYRLNFVLKNPPTRILHNLVIKKKNMEWNESESILGFFTFSTSRTDDVIVFHFV